VNDGSALKIMQQAQWRGLVREPFLTSKTFVGEASESVSDFGTGVPAYM
jgi:hypothetical protein